MTREGLSQLIRELRAYRTELLGTLEGRTIEIEGTDGYSTTYMVNPNIAFKNAVGEVCREIERKIGQAILECE